MINLAENNMSIDNQFDDEELVAFECKCETRNKDCADYCDACEGYSGKCNACKTKFACVVRFDEHMCQPKGEINGKN